MEESWEIDVNDVFVKDRIGFGSYAEVYALSPLL